MSAPVDAAERLRAMQARVDGWCREEVAACLRVVDQTAEDIAREVRDGDPCAELLRVEAETLRAVIVAAREAAARGAFVPGRRLDIAGGVRRWLEAGLVEVATTRENLASWVESWNGPAAGTPRNNHARRRVAQVAAARIRERGLDGSTACDRRRYVDRARVESVLQVTRAGVGNA